MTTKLTLSIDQSIIEKAKKYAQERNVSLSSLVENYLQKLVSEYKPENLDETSVVEELSGIINLKEDYDYKEDLGDHLAKKHQ